MTYLVYFYLCDRVIIILLDKPGKWTQDSKTNNFVDWVIDKEFSSENVYELIYSN